MYLHKLCDDCKVQVRSLGAVGLVSDTYGCLFCPVLLKMILDETALKFTQQAADNVPRAKDLMEVLKLEVESRERTANLTQNKEGYQPGERNAGCE